MFHFERILLSKSLCLSDASALRTIVLERSRDGQSKRFARFAEEILGSVSRLRLSPGVVSCAARRKQVACNQLRRTALHLAAQLDAVAERTLIETQRVVGEVEPERGIDDRHDDAELGAERHARNDIRARHNTNVRLESDRGTGDASLARAVVVDRAAIEG